MKLPAKCGSLSWRKGFLCGLAATFAVTGAALGIQVAIPRINLGLCGQEQLQKKV